MKLTTTAGRGRPEVEQPKVGPKGETRGSERVKDTEQATPETDAKVSRHIGFYSCATVPAELCRRIERERDEARAGLVDLDNMQDQRDFAMKVIKRLERERDEALEQVEELTAVIKGLRAIMRQDATK